MRLQMRGVDHDPLRLAALARQFGEILLNAPRRLQRTNRLQIVLCGPYSGGASRQRSPFLITKTIALTIRRSSIRATPCESRKYRSIPRACRR
jgi:hypothetical protein